MALRLGNIIFESLHGKTQYAAGFQTCAGQLKKPIRIKTVDLEGFGCTTRIEGYQRILPVPLAFLMPFLVAAPASLLSEMVFRLFGHLFLFQRLKIKVFSVIISAVLWAFFVPAFWNIQLSLYPLDYEIFL